MKVEEIRNGKSLKTIFTEMGHGTVESSSMFFEVDNLDTKSIKEAENNYEKIFITIRDYLKEQESVQHNLSSEAARLSIAQGISDLLRQSSLIRKEEK